jgi:hypothetical protein
MKKRALSTWTLVTLRRFDCFASAGDACRFERGTLNSLNEIRRLALSASELLLKMRARLSELVTPNF